MARTLEETKQDNKLTTEVLKLFPRQGEWTEADYFRLPETNKIIELSKGRLIMTPSPTTRHQRIILKLSRLLIDHTSLLNLGEVIVAPMDVRLWEGTVRQPDIVFMNNEHLDRITEEMWGVPDLVMEILSEGTTKVDKGDKYLEYQKAGILEYWIVDPFKQVIDIYTLEDGTYILSGKYGIGEIAKSKLLIGFDVLISKVLG